MHRIKNWPGADLYKITRSGEPIPRKPISTLWTGRARGRGGTITRQQRPEKYWRYVYADCAVLVLCAAALLWMIISPESFWRATVARRMAAAPPGRYC
jgi:hypothetical protein